MMTFLKFLTEEDNRLLLEKAENAQFEEDDVILREGEERHAIFFIRSGSVRVERTHLEFRVEISRLGQGEIFGEMSFVEGFVASASCVADGPVEVDIIDEAHIEQLAANDPGFAGRFYQSLAEILSRRLRETTVRGIAEYSWGGTDPDLKNLREDAYLTSDEDAWGAPNWNALDDDY